MGERRRGAWIGHWQSLQRQILPLVCSRISSALARHLAGGAEPDNPKAGSEAGRPAPIAHHAYRGAHRSGKRPLRAVAPPFDQSDVGLAGLRELRDRPAGAIRVPALAGLPPGSPQPSPGLARLLVEALRHPDAAHARAAL
jgi:hypothetical protein